MKKKKFYIILSFLSLCAGGFIYIVFRPDTIVAQTVYGIFPILKNPNDSFSNSFSAFLKYYFPDFLWAFSFYCALNAISDSPQALFKNGLAVSALGVFWETGQYFEIFSGTGDFLDILMYLAAVVTVVFVEKNYQKGVKK